MQEESRQQILAQRFGQSLKAEIRDKLAANDFSKWSTSLEAAKSVEKFIKNSPRATNIFDDSINAISGFETRKQSFQKNGSYSVRFEEKEKILNPLVTKINCLYDFSNTL